MSNGAHLSLSQVLDHPVTRLVIGGFKALLGVIIMLAAFIGTTYVGDIRGTIEKLAAQMGDMDARVDTLEREAAIRAAVYQQDRAAYEKYRASWCTRNPALCGDSSESAPQ